MVHALIKIAQYCKLVDRALQLCIVCGHRRYVNYEFSEHDIYSAVARAFNSTWRVNNKLVMVMLLTKP